MLLELRNVSKVFGGVRALQCVSFDVAPGEVLCLAGENGCGKSTLIKIISGVYQPEPGAEMLFDGKTITDGADMGVPGYNKVSVKKGPGAGVIVTGQAWVEVDKQNYKKYAF